MAVTSTETTMVTEAGSGKTVNSAKIEKKSPSSKKKRNSKPGLRVIGGRIYDPKNGKTCHQCRQKTMDFMVACTQMKKDKLCTIRFCHKCLFNRYGEKAEEMAKLDNWKCPKCRGICNCSFCMKKNGHLPTGIMIHTAKATGYASVHELLDKRGAEFIKASPKVATPQKRKHDGDKENKGEESKVKKQLFKKARKESRSNKPDKQDPPNDVEMKENVDGMSNSPIHKEKIAKLKPYLRKHNEADVAIKQLQELEEKISTLPSGTQLSEIMGFEVDPEDIGLALQFLEFCSTFSKVFNIKKGQPECILLEIVRGRVGRRGLSAASVQLQINLLSTIQTDRGERPVSGSAKKGDAWLKSLCDIISESEYFNGLPEDCLSAGILGYDNLPAYWKLRILTFLCDETLSTEKVRCFMDAEISKSKEEMKMNSEKVLAAKRKKQEIKEKLKNKMAKAILSERDSAALSIEEHANIVSKIKEEAEKAQAEILETIDALSLEKQRSALRTEPIFLEGSGRVYWKLNGYLHGSAVLLQDLDKWDQLENGEKWYSFSEDDEKIIEEHVSAVRKWRKNLKNALRQARKEKKITSNQDPQEKRRKEKNVSISVLP